MKIGDILNIVGGFPLKQFEFGEALVRVLNQHLAQHVVSRDQLLTVEDTGEEVRSALYRLPPRELAELILVEFDLGSQQVVHEPEPVPSAECEPGPLPPPPTSAPAPAPPPPSPITRTITQPLGEKARSRLALTMGATLVVATLLLAVSMSASTVKTGEMPDSSALRSVVQILGEVIKSYIQRPAAPPSN